jgi:hypothetical protein
MQIPTLTLALVLSALTAASFPVTAAMSQTTVIAGGASGAVDQRAHQIRSEDLSASNREVDLDAKLNAALSSGALPRARFESAKLELENIRVQEGELRARDGGLNATDYDFIMARLGELDRRLFAPETLAVAAAPPAVSQPAPALASLSETPGALTCDGHRVLLSIGRDHATASVQRYGSANIALIVEAVASPYNAEDGITLHVSGPGLNAKVDGARAGQYLMASTTTNFSLKSKHSATIEASVASRGSVTPQYVKIWGSCSEG